MALTDGPKREAPPQLSKRHELAKQQDRGTKREDPETGKKFYDLGRDPVVSPYTGKSYPRSFFEQTAPAPVRTRPSSAPAAVAEEEEVVEAEVEEEAAEPGAPEIVSLEEADAEESGDEDEEDIPEVEDVEDVEDIGEDDSDVFLEEDEDEDENLDFDVGSSDER